MQIIVSFEVNQCHSMKRLSTISYSGDSSSLIRKFGQVLAREPLGRNILAYRERSLSSSLPEDELRNVYTSPSV